MSERILQYLPAAMRQARAMGCMFPSHIDTEDLVSVAYLAVVEADHRWDERKGKYAAFMHARVRGAILDYLRSLDMLGRSERKRLGPSFDATQQFKDECDHESKGISLSQVPASGMEIEDRAILMEFFDGLKCDRDRTMVAMAVEGFPQREIAEALNVHASWVSQSLSRGIAAYREAR